MVNHFLAFWNLENLFAPEGHPDREPWLARQLASELSGWTQALFDTKISQLASIISQMNGGRGPDILGVCEVENAFVLQQLTARLNGQINNRNYAVVHVDATQDQRGIDTAFVYDSDLYSVDPLAIFSHFVMRRTGTRDITQVTFTTQGGRDLVALCNHWPSRSGGTYESRGFRMTAGETLSYWHQRIWQVKGNEIPIIAMGDFNDDPFDESLQFHARATRERGDVERAQTAVRFYNLAWRYLAQQGQDRNGNPKLLNGTLYFDGNGNVFDQILVSKGLLIQGSPIKVDETTARMELYPEMVDHRVAYGPIRFGLPKGNAAKNVDTGGFSDHFPVSVVLQEQ
ncbi:MAG TPA: endonuclease/exonuclease/phosphatase family protein [Anaerolineales bacterium]|nr:endonuclease/exonuclease/phosphatase family protein [Anaerolineales bacterium]